MLALLPSWVDPTAHYILHEGLTNTIIIAVGAVTGSLVIGVVLGTFLTIELRPVRALIRLYIEVWRGLPIIVTMFMVFYLAPSLNPALEFSFNTAAIIGLTLWGSAQIAETTRGALQSIPREQHEASAALGFGWLGRHVFVIVPQAARRMLPPIVTLVVGIIQNTTLAAVIGASELLGTGERQIARLGSYPPAGIGQIKALQIYGAIAVMFFLICFPLTRLAAYLEKRLQ
jgi:polar amino acid transport system permease protein